jgi:hypothetical protein
LLDTGTHKERFTAVKGVSIAMQVPIVYPVNFSIALEWSDNSRSDFGTFSTCSPVVERKSRDGRAKIDLAVR